MLDTSHFFSISSLYGSDEREMPLKNAPSPATCGLTMAQRPETQRVTLRSGRMHTGTLSVSRTQFLSVRLSLSPFPSFILSPTCHADCKSHSADEEHLSV